MKQISASKFKEQCLYLLDHMEQDGLIVTKHGKPVAKVFPISSSNSSLIGCMEDRIKVKGTIFSTGIKWDAES